MTEVSKNYTTSVVGAPKINIEINKFVGGKKVIDTGALISYNSEDIIIIINNVRIRFEFLEDDTVKDKDNIIIRADPEVSNATIIGLYNMKNSLSEGTPNPIHIANISTKKIFISFFITTVSFELGARIFHYTVLEGK